MPTEEWSREGKMAEEKWRLVRRETLEQDEFLEVSKHDYELPDGSRMEGFYFLRERDGVHIVVVTGQREVLLVRQYRAGIDAFTYECPAGFREDDDEDMVEQARRELREETGYEAERWYALGVIHPAPHRVRKTDHAFLALDARQVTEQQLDSTEFVQFERVPLDKVWQMIREGEITSAGTIAVLCKAMLRMEGL